MIQQWTGKVGDKISVAWQNVSTGVVDVAKATPDTAAQVWDGIKDFTVDTAGDVKDWFKRDKKNSESHAITGIFPSALLIAFAATVLTF